MKSNWKLLIAGTTLLMGFCVSAWADPPEPPPPPSGHGQNGNAPAGAPIDGGLGILLAMGATYGGKKAWSAYRKCRPLNPRKGTCSSLREDHFCEAE
ncbi:MAG: hypothetical protein IH596_02475 [Bacteroidales bacterium]|nr:hypothetical protein [Bacteroidales bacterium]